MSELVHAALLKVANTTEEMKLSGAGGAFTGATGANKEAIAECLNSDQPLLAVIRSAGKSQFVALTPAGFERIARDIAEEKVGSVAKSVAAAVPIAARADFLQTVIGRTPLAAAELTPLFEEAVAAEKAESTARIAATEKRRAAEEASLKALKRAEELIHERHKERIDSLKRQWEAEGQNAADLPAKKPAPKPVPTTAQEKDFRRDVAAQLAAAWRATWELNKPESREFLESAMWNINGFKLIGEVGAKVAYSGRYHDSIAGVFSGDSVRIVRPGWALEEEAGEFVVLKAVIEK